MEKLLPLEEKPCLTSYFYYSYTLGILEGNGLSCKGVLFNHFTTLFFPLQLNCVIFLKGFPLGGRLRKSFYEEKINGLASGSITYVKRLIDENKYVIIYLNNKTITNVPSTRDWIHDWLLFGYNKNGFHAAGYIFNPESRALTYKTIEIRYEDFLTSLANSPLLYQNRALSVRCTPESIRLRKIKRAIFIYAYNLLPLLFNAKIYRKYAFLFRLRYHKNEKNIDLHSFKTFDEHKRLLQQMMHEFVPGSTAAQEFQSIVNLASTIQMTALKYNITKRNKQKAIDTICDALHKLRVEEPRIMRIFYRELKGLPKP